MESFLSHLASQGVAASTQNQAFNVLLFFYREAMKVDLGPVNALRAKQPTTIPDCPTPQEVGSLLAAVQDVHGYPTRFIVHLLYGCGLRVCYWPSFDRVDMPKPESFRTGQDYYSVLFHELTHATGHESRVNRKGVSGSDGEWSAFGSTPYAKEELLAEMGSAFLCGQAGIVERTIDNSTAYIQSWLKRLKDDRRLVVQAAAQAQKAADFILGWESGVEQ